MTKRRAGALLLVAAACGSPRETPAPNPPAKTAWTDPAPHQEGFIAARGARLDYLDWGGSGANLILIHGLGDNPHVFDDLVPALGGKFRVVAYARRGHGRSSKEGPFDTATLVADLTAVMDSLGIGKAHLAGWSMGGNEITAMAAMHPERVGRIVYLDAGYDWGDPANAAAFKDVPVALAPPPGALNSLDAYRAWQLAVFLPSLRDPSRVEAYIRDLVDIQPNGAVHQVPSDSVSTALYEALLSSHRDYTKVKVPALAIYATVFIDSTAGDSGQRARAAAWEQQHMGPFRIASMQRIKRELRGVETMTVPGSHMGFVFASRAEIASAMSRFLSAPE
ncbi:MAG: alpha/beta hydrolase [Gemmatimonadota bacterium]